MDENKILLGTAVSAPISVLANNDAPFGPAVIHLHLTLNHAWEGWGVRCYLPLQPLYAANTRLHQWDHA